MICVQQGITCVGVCVCVCVCAKESIALFTAWHVYCTFASFKQKAY